VVTLDLFHLNYVKGFFLMIVRDDFVR